MRLHTQKFLLATLVCSLSIVFVTGNASPVLIKTGKKGKDKMILISGGKCGSSTLIKGSKKGGSEMILVGGQQDCDKLRLQVMKQFIPVPYYIPRPVFKYILRHHYVPIRQVVVKPVPVPYPVKSHGENEHFGYNYGATSENKGYGSHNTQNHGYDNHANDYNSYGNSHSDGTYGSYGDYSKSTSYENGYDQGNYAAGSQAMKYSTKPTTATSTNEDPYYEGVYGSTDYNGAYKPNHGSQGDNLSTTSIQIESFLKPNSPRSSDYSSKPAEDSGYSSYANQENFGNNDYDSKMMFSSSRKSKKQQKLLSHQSSPKTSSMSVTEKNTISATPTTSPTSVSTYLSGAFGVAQASIKG